MGEGEEGSLMKFTALMCDVTVTGYLVTAENRDLSLHIMPRAPNHAMRSQPGLASKLNSKSYLGLSRIDL